MRSYRNLTDLRIGPLEISTLTRDLDRDPTPLMAIRTATRPPPTRNRSLGSPFLNFSQGTPHLVTMTTALRRTGRFPSKAQPAAVPATCLQPQCRVYLGSLLNRLRSSPTAQLFVRRKQEAATHSAMQARKPTIEASAHLEKCPRHLRSIHSPAMQAGLPPTLNQTECGKHPRRLLLPDRRSRRPHHCQRRGTSLREWSLSVPSAHLDLGLIHIWRGTNFFLRDDWA